jgi:sensor histidine kinase regulating citrate/malate metabolism
MDEQYKRNIGIILSILFPVALFLLINTHCIMYADRSSDAGPTALFNLLGISLMFAYAVLAIRELGLKTKLESERNALRTKLDQSDQNRYSSALQSHEYARHLQSLQALIGMKHFDQALEYINDITQLPENSAGTYDVGHAALNGLVNAKQNSAHKNLDFQVDVKSSWHDVNLPSWQLSSLVGNLLDNAFEAAENDPQPKVVLSFDRTADCHVVAVANNGSKIKDSQEIMEVGFSSKGSPERGYGLNIVKGIVQDNHGHLLIETEPCTRFTISLPLKKEG